MSVGRGIAARGGFTLLEVMVVVGIIGVLAALAVPNLRQWQADQRLKGAARAVGDAMSLARTEAIRTGDNHIVFFGADINLNPITDVDGAGLVVVLNDGPPATANCAIGATEARRNFRMESGVQLGTVSASVAHPLDTGAGTYSNGWTFTQPPGGSTTDALWVLFRPDGVPVGLNDACTPGLTGSGGGGIYINNGHREYAIVLAPLGGVRVSPWEAGAGTWH